MRTSSGGGPTSDTANGGHRTAELGTVPQRTRQSPAAVILRIGRAQSTESTERAPARACYTEFSPLSSSTYAVRIPPRTQAQSRPGASASLRARPEQDRVCPPASVGACRTPEKHPRAYARFEDVSAAMLRLTSRGGVMVALLTHTCIRMYVRTYARACPEARWPGSRMLKGGRVGRETKGGEKRRRRE